VTLFARGGGGGTEDELRLRILDEMAPPGGIVQLKVRTTEVTPISGGRGRFTVDRAMFTSAEGFGMFATGELAGAAVSDGASVGVSYISNGALTADYPLFVVALRIRPDVAVGAKTLFTFDPGSIWNLSPTGAIQTARISPGTIAAGGTVSITDVVPGEGVWPAGTVVSVRGIGFDGQTRLRVNDVETSASRLISANEMQFTLLQAAQMRGVRLKVEHPDNTDIYYAYMRGITSTVSSRALLAATEPIFGVTPRLTATLGPFASLNANQYAGLALQNPTRGEVAVGIALYDADGALVNQSARTMESRHRLALEVSELLDGVAPPPGSSLVITASAPIDAIGLLCDEGSWTVSASLPLEAQH